MATTFIDFVPSQVIAPTYQVTLDGNVYSLTIAWNLFAQRYYFNLATLDGTTVLYAALVGSPIGIDLETMSWANGKVTGETATNHKLNIGETLIATITGCVPSTYNGTYQIFVTGRNTFTYQIATDPGQATVVGSLQQNIDLVGSMFTSTLVYRQPNKRFEVSDG